MKWKGDKMAKILIDLPLNISRTLEEMLKEVGREMEKKDGITLEIINRHQCHSDNANLENKFLNSNVPDLVIGHAEYFSTFSEKYLKENFRSLPNRFPIRTELKDAGFPDEKGFFHPFTVIPFAMFYNPGMLGDQDLPEVWEDVLDDCWAGRIIMPDKQHMAPKMLSALMQMDYPEKISNFKQNFIFSGAPINVVNAVDEEQYPIGITNITFARISGNKNIRLLWPKDGFFCMPQIMAFSNQADERLLEVGDFLLSRKVQEFLAFQTFVPVSSDVEMPQILIEHQFKLKWKGWEDFFQVMNKDKRNILRTTE